MELLINIITAWIAVGLMALLLVIYVLRRWIQISKLPKDGWQRELNRKLRRPHKWLGVGALLAAFIHGLYSSVAILTINKGTILFVIFILMGLSFMFRKKLKIILPWMKIHRYLAIASLVFLLLHFIEVGWFVGIDPIIASVKRDLEASDVVTEQEAIPEATTNNEPGDGVPNDIGGSTNKGQHGNQNNSSTTSTTITDNTIDVIDMTTVTIPDGTYSGEAVAYQPGLKVDVTVKDNKIIAVVITDHNEVKQQFWGTPVKEIPLAIIEAQSTEVDIVSGATFTSVGIMTAVEDALGSAIE